MTSHQQPIRAQMSLQCEFQTPTNRRSTNGRLVDSSSVVTVCFFFKYIFGWLWKHHESEVGSFNIDAPKVFFIVKGVFVSSRGLTDLS